MCVFLLEKGFIYVSVGCEYGFKVLTVRDKMPAAMKLLLFCTQVFVKMSVWDYIILCVLDICIMGVLWGLVEDIQKQTHSSI